MDTIPGLIGSAGSAGTDGDDVINGQWGNELVGTTLVAAATLTSLDSIDAGLGQNTLNVNIRDAASSLTGVNTTNVQTVNVKSVGAATVDTTSGFTGVTKLNITQAIGNVTATAAATTAINVSGVTGTALGVKEVFTATFAGTEVGSNTTIAFDGVTSTLAAAAGGTALATDFAGDYNANAAANWVAVDNLDGTVTFTAKVAGTKTDVVTANFVVTDPGAHDSTAVTVTAALPTTQGVGAAGTTTTVDGGSSQTVSVAKGGVTVGATTVTTGDISVTSSDQGIDTIAVDGGKAVTVKATGSTGGTISVGQGGATTDLPTGAVSITQNLKSDGAAALTGGAITTVGGTTVDINVNATSTATVQTAAAALTVGKVSVTAGANTTSVTVNQNDVANTFTKAAVALVPAQQTIKFAALDSGKSTTVGGLTFTAEKNLTGAEVAAAFAKLVTTDTQSEGGVVGNGEYTVNLITAWTSAAASGDTVVFTAAAHNTAALIVGGSGTAPTSTYVTGTIGAAAITSTNSVAFGDVVVNEAGTASITSVTVNGYKTADLGKTGADLDALTTLSLTDSAGAAEVATAAKTLGLTVNNVKHAVSLDETAATIATLNVTATGKDSAFALKAAVVKDLTVAGDKVANLTGSTLTLLEKVTVSGSAGLNLGAVVATKSINTTATTGATTATIDGAVATYAGGAGFDAVTLATSTALAKAMTSWFSASPSPGRLLC